MTKLIATRGYSSSGKTTFALKWLAEDPENRVNLNRDDLRDTLFNVVGLGTQEQEQIVTKVQRTAAEAALKAGKDVILSDTNLRAKFLKDWADLAADLGADFEVKDFHVDLHTCLAHNRQRYDSGGRFVPPKAIEAQAKRFPYPWPEIKPRPNLKLSVVPYEDQEGLPSVVIVDVDGTVADMTKSGRNPFQWQRVGEDEPIQKIIDIVHILAQHHQVIFFSGRDGECYGLTRKWLDDNGFSYANLFTRPAGDNRTDFIIKNELFDAHIRGKFNVAAVIDDRLQVARLWHQLGLPILRVGDPDAAF